MWTIEQVRNELNNLRIADGLPEIKVPVKINPRLSRTLGRVRYTGLRPTSIEFSQDLLKDGTDNDIINVIKHEYVHYYLLVKTGENHGHDAMFKAKCAAIGCEHIYTHNSLEGESKYKYEVWCTKCNKIVATRSRRCKLIDYVDYYACANCDTHNLKVIQNW